MDLYQILSTHSRPWSEREIMFFGILLAAGAAFLLAAAEQADPGAAGPGQG